MKISIQTRESFIMMGSKKISNGFVTIYYEIPKELADEHYNSQRHFWVKSKTVVYHTWSPPAGEGDCKFMEDNYIKKWLCTTDGITLYGRGWKNAIDTETPEFMLVKLSAKEITY